MVGKGRRVGGKAGDGTCGRATRSPPNAPWLALGTLYASWPPTTWPSRPTAGLCAATRGRVAAAAGELSATG